MSVCADAGMNGPRFRILKALKKFALNVRLDSSLNNFGSAKSFPIVISTDAYPGPRNIFRQAQPGPSVLKSKFGHELGRPGTALQLGKIPLMYSCLLGLEITPPL